MISLLRGRIVEKSLGRIVLDVQGVGYGVTVPLSTYYRLPELGGEAELKIHTYIKDEAIELFGFLTDDERRMFTTLLGVPGVGPKGAINILSNVSPTELVSAISSGELSRKRSPESDPSSHRGLSQNLRIRFQRSNPHQRWGRKQEF